MGVRKDRLMETMQQLKDGQPIVMHLPAIIVGWRVEEEILLQEYQMVT
jgi:hypothetical protein